MERPPESSAPGILHRDPLDPELLLSFLFSLGVHLFFIAIVVAVSFTGASRFERRNAYTVGLVGLDSGSALLGVGPLAGSGPPVPPAAMLHVPPAPAKPPPKPEVKAEPKPAPAPEVKPEPKPPPKPEVKAEPKPAPAPEVKPEPKPPPKPEVKAEPKPAPAPDAKTEPKPPPAPTAAAAERPAASGPPVQGGQNHTTTAAATVPGGGGTPAAGSGRAAGGIVRDAEFVAYYNLMISRIKANWVWAGQETDNLAVTLRFSIESDGRISGVVSVSSSGNLRFDHSVLNAVRAVRDLGPPPDQHRREFADVELVFRASDLSR